MQIGTKFSIAIHILLSVEVFKDEYKVASDFLATSANTNPVVIRKILPYKLRKQPQNREFLHLFGAKNHKSDRLLDVEFLYYFL
jgi:hypothetical protein